MPLCRRIAPLAGMVALVTMATPAAAHVTVNPGAVPKGGFTKLAFRVPNERPDSGTVKLEVTFPPEHPLRSVSVRPQAGWTFSVEKTKLDRPIEREGREPVTEVVSKITWTGGPINPGEFDEFEVSAGPMPEDVGQLVLKAVQTYASGEVVRWIEEAPPGAEEPEFPAPVLKLTASAGHGQGGDAGTEGGTRAAGTSDVGEPPAGDLVSKDDVDGASHLALVALILGGIGLLLGGASLLRQRKPGAPTTVPSQTSA